MAVYQYTAKDQGGNEFSGVYTNVHGAEMLRRELRKLGYVLVRARRQRQRTSVTGRIKQRDVAAFAYKFASIYSAGLPVLQCLEMLEDQADSGALRNVIADVRRRVETGSSLTRAFGHHRKVLSDFFLGMIAAGESAGKLPETLAMSAQYLEKRLELQQKVRAAFVYPAVVGLVCLTVVTLLLIFVVPTFAQLYQKLHVDLPGPTRMLVLFSGILRDRWWVLLLTGTGLLLGGRRLVGHRRIRGFWDRKKLRLPVLGPLTRLVMVSQFIRTFGMLISVGVPIIDALDVASQVTRNEVIFGIAADLQKATRAGRPVSVSLGAHDIFPSMIVQLVASGEEAGVLPEMLKKGADLLDRDIDRMATSLLVKLEPALTAVMGIIIGLILMGVYLPMFDYMACLR